MTLGKQIRELRNKKGMPARVLAERVGLHIRYVYDIERGRYRPSLDTLRKIADALDVPVAAFFVEDRGGWEATVCEYVKRFPPEIQEFLTQEQAMSYLAAVRELATAGLSPEDIRDVGIIVARMLRRRKS